MMMVINSFVLSLVLLLALEANTQCPDIPKLFDDVTCFCNHPTFGGWEITCTRDIFADRVISKLYRIRYTKGKRLKVECRFDNTTTFRTDLFAKVNDTVEKVFFEGCFLHQTPIKSLLSNFELTDFTFISKKSRKLINLDDNLLKGFKNLTDIHVEKLKIGNLSTFLSSASKLSKFRLANSDLTSISSNVFSSTPNLTVVYFVKNTLKYVPVDLFHGLKRLKEIHFYRNNLENIPRKMFENLGSVTVLKLSSNLIANLHRDTFHDMASLQKLSISDNKISHLPNDLFDHNKNLLKLMLNSNPLEYIQRRHLSNLTNLEELQLNNCNISMIDENLLWDLGNLKTLYLSHNSIESIPPLTFANSRNLTNLKIDYNNLKMLKSTWLKGLGHLKFISLIKNGIETIEPRTFHDLLSLERLNVKNNMLTELDAQLFANNQNLKQIVLASNQVQDVRHHFENLKALEILDVRRNNLSEIPVLNSDHLRKVHLIWNNIKRIDFNNIQIDVLRFKPPAIHLSYNPAICDCDIKGFLTYLQNKYEEMPVKFLIHRLYCQNPSEFQGIRVMYLNPEDVTCPST